MAQVAHWIRDGDGVPDYLDADPFTTKGARVDENGKELDSDNDGVADSQDIEPNTKEGALVNFQGKTINLESAGGESTTNVSGSYYQSTSRSTAQGLITGQVMINLQRLRK